MCAFVKKRDDTVLRVVWNGGLRLTHTGPKGSSCRRWFFSINGQECSEPKTIDAMLTVRTRGTNVHRPAYGRFAFMRSHTYNVLYMLYLQSRRIKLYSTWTITLCSLALLMLH